MMENSNTSYKTFLLILISFLALFFELALIRWIPGQVQIFGYFTNLILISAFLGIGIGCATHNRGKNAPWVFPVWLAFLVSVCITIKKLGGLFLNNARWGEYYFTFIGFGVVPLFILVIFIFFISVLVHIPLGRLMGRYLSLFPPLWGYSLNLAGSLLGISAMALFCFFRARPFWWFLAGIILYLPFWAMIPRWRMKIISASAGLVSLGLVWIATGDEIWSPYYKIKFSKSLDIKLGLKALSIPLKEGEYSLTINDILFQFALNLDPENAKNDPGKELAIALYNLPYSISNPKSVLIIGAGLGNDTAQAVRNNIPRIVAVEIDPVITELGVKFHPEHPYQDPRVELIVDDGRHYLETTSEKFDLIIYGILDSQRLTSYMSVVRLETFLYTYDGLKKAKEKLNPGGLLVISNVAAERGSLTSLRLFRMMNQIFPNNAYALSIGEKKEVRMFRFDIFMGGRDISSQINFLPEVEDVTEVYRSAEPVRISTDNWPFLYLTTKAFWKSDYFKTLMGLIIISFLLVLWKVPETRKRINPHFFLLGAGFLLLQTKSIIELSISFGSTWMVNTVAIASFLLMALLANLVVYKFNIKRFWIFYLLLFLAIALNALFPVSKLVLSSRLLQALIGGCFVALPVFFSGVIFAVNFRKVASPAQALGANIMGAVLGGFTEYSSLFLGYRYLYLIAGAFYLLSWIFYRKKDNSA